MKIIAAVMLCLCLTACSGPARQMAEPTSQTQYQLAFPASVEGPLGDSFALKTMESSYLFFQNCWEGEQAVCLIYTPQPDGTTKLLSQIPDLHVQTITQLSNGNYLIQGLQSRWSSAERLPESAQSELICLDTSFQPLWQHPLPSGRARIFATHDWIIVQSFQNDSPTDGIQCVQISLDGEKMELDLQASEYIWQLTDAAEPGQMIGTFCTFEANQHIIRQIDAQFQTQWEILLPLDYDEQVEALFVNKESIIAVTNRNSYVLQDAQIVNTQDISKAYGMRESKYGMRPIGGYRIALESGLFGFFREIYTRKDMEISGAFYAVWKDNTLQRTAIEPREGIVYAKVFGDGHVSMVGSNSGVFTVYEY